METESVDRPHSLPCPPRFLWCLEPQLKTHLHTPAPATVNSFPEMLALCLARSTGKDVTDCLLGQRLSLSGVGRGDQVHSQVVWDTHPGHFKFLIFSFLSELFPAASRLSSTVSHRDGGGGGGAENTSLTPALALCHLTTAKRCAD